MYKWDFHLDEYLNYINADDNFFDKSTKEIDKIIEDVIKQDIEILKNKVKIISYNESQIITDNKYNLKPYYQVYRTLQQNTTINTNYKKSRRLKWLINELQERNIKIGQVKWNGNCISIYCPVCEKNNDKTYIIVNQFKVMTHSKTDCTNERHINEYEKLRQELLKKWQEEQNPDFTNVKWNSDYVHVEFNNEENKKETCTLTEYNQRYNNIMTKPKITKFNPLKVIENVKCLLNHYGYSIKYNVILMRFEIYKDGILISNNLQEHLIYLQNTGDKKFFNMTKEKWYDSILAISKENEYNPIQDYLRSCHEYYLKNPDNDILKQLQNTIISNTDMKNDYIKKFLLQMVYLVCSKNNDTTSGQFVLMLQSRQQGIGKTTWLRNLIPKDFRHEYFLEGKSLDLNNKDSVLETMTNWIVELGEIASTFKKSDQELLKNFITSFKDKVRPPYFKSAIENKRRTSLCGSTNDTEYLRDITGSRRFLTIECDKIDYNHDVDINMLWGYIYSLYLKDEPYYYELDDIKKIENNNQKYIAKKEEQLIIEEYFNLKPDKEIWYTCQELFEMMEEQYTISTKYKLSKFLKLYGALTKRSKSTILFNVEVLKNDKFKKK